uniref:TRAF interacting protein n=1 Tax=Malurus cyaneus samueli TaxID=2593467 RepID=A0A8C5ULV6_9PASS
MYILLSGNPPFYEEADEDDYENHDKNLFRKILAGDYEFDPPYWDDISQAAKELVTRLMEVEQDQRITAEEAISHEWISGNAASDKNIKDGVCAQIEKNFARAKWKVSVRLRYNSVSSQPSLVPHHGAMSLVGLPVPAPPGGLAVAFKRRRAARLLRSRGRDPLRVPFNLRWAPQPFPAPPCPSAPTAPSAPTFSTTSGTWRPCSAGTPSTGTGERQGGRGLGPGRAVSARGTFCGPAPEL